MWRVALSFIVILSLGAGASSCVGWTSGTPAVEASLPKLKVWIEESDNPQLLQETFGRYAAANNVEVEVVCPAPMDKIMAALSSSDGPDIVLLSDYVVAQSIAQRGLTQDLKPLGTQAGIDFADIYPAALISCQQGDRLACLPWSTDAMALFWNKDLFEDAGLDPEQPPRTMEELAHIAERLTEWDARGKLTQVGFLPDWPWPGMDNLVGLFGGSYYADDGRTLTVNSSANVRAYQWAQQFYTHYGIKDVNELKSGFGPYASVQNPFYADQVAMVMDGEWLLGPTFLKNFAPELYYGVAPFPVPADRADAYGSTVVGATVVVVPANTRDSAAAARLLAWLVSPAVLADVLPQYVNLPSSRQAANAPQFGQIRHFQLFMEMLGHPRSIGHLSSPIHEELNDALAKAQERMWQEGADPKQLLDEIQREFEPQLAAAWAKVK